MGVSRYKITEPCTCGCDYGGNCGKVNIFLFCYNRSVDIGTLYVNGEKAFCLNDDGLAAVRKVMAGETSGEELTEQERKLI
jgi:hypothetical protein